MTSKLASLHSGLVARKGEAMPAVSHPLFSYVDAPRREEKSAQAPAPRAWPPVKTTREVEPMDEPATAVESEKSGPDVRPEEALEHRPFARAVPPAAEAPPRPEPEVVSRPAPVVRKPQGPEVQDSAYRHRLTFRMTQEQHHRLRLAAAIKDESLQHLLSEALDNHLDGLCACSLKDCTCMSAAADQK